MTVRYEWGSATAQRWAGGSGRPVPRVRVVCEARPAYAEAIQPTVRADGTDALIALGDRIAELARSIQVAEHEMMRLIVEFDQKRGWAAQGFGSCAEWLAWRVGIQPNAARERVRTAHALAELPRTSAAMAAGRLSYSKVRSLTRVATPESEEALLEFAHAGSAANLERVVRAWKAMDDRRELSLERVRHRNRRFCVWVDEDGSFAVKGRLDPEVGAVLMRAVEAAGDALYRRAGEGDPAEVTPAQRRADALGLVAERALAAGFGAAAFGDEGSDGGASGPVRAERYQALLIVEPDTLVADRESGRSELDGTRVPKETSRRLTCDAGVARVTEARATEARAHVTAVTRGAAPMGSAILGVGRRSRTVPPALRRALQARDRGCRFPGCGSRFTEVHHIVHWADGGRTDLKNLVLLCRRHHRSVHEGAMRVCMDREAKVAFFAPSGRAVFDAPRSPRPSPRSVSRPVREQGPVQEQRPARDRRPAQDSQPARDSRPATAPLPHPPPIRAPWPGADGYRRDRDIPWSLEARARDALDSG